LSPHHSKAFAPLRRLFRARRAANLVGEIDGDYVTDGDLVGTTVALPRRLRPLAEVRGKCVLECWVISRSAIRKAVACAVFVSTIFDAPHGRLNMAVTSAVGGLQPEACPKLSTRHSSLIRPMFRSVV
jgi:hypothetical protein